MTAQHDTFKLDKWDYQLIHTFKCCLIPELEEKQIREIWSKRCLLDPVFVDLGGINGHLLDIVYGLNLLDARYKFVEFISELGEDHRFSNWGKGKRPFQERLLDRLGSLLAHTEVKYLPGYLEWYTNERSKCIVEVFNPLI